MGPSDSLQAIQWLKPKHVLPAHYNTWDPIKQDAAHWADSVRDETDAEPVVLQPGESFNFRPLATPGKSTERKKDA